jgi:hypothetical protein
MNCLPFCFPLCVVHTDRQASSELQPHWEGSPMMVQGIQAEHFVRWTDVSNDFHMALEWGECVQCDWECCLQKELLLSPCSQSFHRGAKPLHQKDNKGPLGADKEQSMERRNDPLGETHMMMRWTNFTMPFAYCTEMMPFLASRRKHIRTHCKCLSVQFKYYHNASWSPKKKSTSENVSFGTVSASCQQNNVSPFLVLVTIYLISSCQN